VIPSFSSLTTAAAATTDAPADSSEWLAMQIPPDAANDLMLQHKWKRFPFFRPLCSSDQGECCAVKVSSMKQCCANT
jgi:hypothetical protein